MTHLECVVDVLDYLRQPINAAARNERLANKPLAELYPYYGATGLVGYIDDYIFDGRYILLGEDGAPFFDTNSEKAYINSGKTWVNNHAHILEAKIYTDYLCNALNAIHYNDYVTGTTRLKLTQADMRRIKMPIPPLAEQYRIVKVIETAFHQLNEIAANLSYQGSQ